MQGNKSILFVSHKANRSGAPVLLCNIIKAFKKSSSIPFKILVLEEGELVNDFMELGDTYVWNTKKKHTANTFTGLVKAAFARIKFIAGAYYILFSVRNTSLVFFNTITNGHTHKKLLFLKCKHVCYVHEMEAAIQMLTNAETLNTVLTKTDFFLAVSNAVKENLVKKHQISGNKINVVATPMAITNRCKKDYSNYTDSLIKNNKIKQPAVLVGLVASSEWRKGFDLLMPLVKIYFSLFPQSTAYFIWKGFKKEGTGAYLDMYDIEKSTIGERLIILPHGNDSIDCMAAFDIHLLLSREDPYPLVVLEAASFGIPTVCFANAGGAPEFVEDDAGCTVPYGDLLQMAKCVHKFAIDPELRKAMGSVAKQKLSQRHSEPEAISTILQTIQKFYKPQ